ncbi:MAG: amidase [Chloroflexi bacterium]|nr:amidase [Ardenticatenaceae bacterium]MBL1128897.1 amidase [Chloroflexota bacterium]NOG34976.1 amidase [Chloroflexota bacterium]
MPPSNSLPILAAALRSGELSLTGYLDQLMAHFNEREPEVLAFVPEKNRFQRLTQEAQVLLQKYPNVGQRPSLFGVPIGVKDIFHVKGFETQAGSRLPTRILQGDEAASVTGLRRAGALILGKTVTTEFAYFAPGPTRNPHNPAHTPGGSSSGSAAAVAAGLSPLTLGTQTIGSINRPAAFCGVVGYKPSYDRISRVGVIPLAGSLDHIGGFTTDVAGMQMVAALLCADWDPTLAAPTHRPVLGIPAGPYLERASATALTHFSQVCARLRETGFTLVDVPTMADFDEIYARHNLIVAAEAARTHRDWFREHRALYHEKTRDLIERGQQISKEQLTVALAGRSQLRSQLTDLMFAHGLDGWLSPPAMGPAPAGLESTGDPVMNLPWTHSGLPTVTLPAGKDAAGLPLGLQLTGHWYADEELLGFAAQIEKVLGF